MTPSQNIQCVNYEAYICCNATRPLLQLPSSVGNGWNQDNTGSLGFDYMGRPAAPDAVLEFTQCHCNNNCSSRQCSCKRENLVCTDACGCDQALCENKEMYTNDSDSEDD